MGQSSSKEINTELTPFEIDEVKVIKAKVDTGGPDAMVEHIIEHLDKWKNEAVNIGITGRYRTGKSTFINAVLGLKPGQIGAAKSGSGNTTRSVSKYEHPTNQQIIMYDFPGVGTPEFPRETYMKNIESSRCDYFLIFFDAVISEHDVWLAENLLAINTPFCFVRSMIDRDKENAKYDGKDESKVLTEIRERATTTMSRNDAIKNVPIFFISGRHTHIGEFYMLLNHMDTNLPVPKFDALVFSLSILAREVIEKKYQKLKTRVRFISFGAAGIAATPIPVVDLCLNIALLIKEILHYKHTFGFDDDKCEHLSSGVKEKFNLRSILVNRMPLREFIITQLGKVAALAVVQSAADLIFPGIGSLVSAYTTLVIVHRFLSKLLEDFRHDAIIVYDYIYGPKTRITH